MTGTKAALPLTIVVLSDRESGLWMWMVERDGEPIDIGAERSIGDAIRTANRRARYFRTKEELFS